MSLKKGSTEIGTLVKYEKGIGLPREVNSSGNYAIPSDTSFSLPSNATGIGAKALKYAFQDNTYLTSVDLSSLTSVNGVSALEYAFQGCTNLTSVNLDSLANISGRNALQYAFSGCTNLTSADLSSLASISGGQCMEYAFNGCTSLTSIDLHSLSYVSNGGLSYAFNGCSSLVNINLDGLTAVYTDGFSAAFQDCSSLSSLTFKRLSFVEAASFRVMCNRCSSLQNMHFYSLNSSSFGSGTNQFDSMLANVSGCTVHFPISIQNTIGSWASVTAGFGGTNTTVLFDIVQTITINSVDYAQSIDDDITGYRAFKNNDTIVYVSDSQQPAIGDSAYSDAGTTVFGTITGIA